MEDAPSPPEKTDEATPPAPQKSGENHAHRYDVGPGFEIAVRGEGKHGVEVSVTKDADGEHRHGSINRRLESLEQSVAELAARLAKVEAAARVVERTA